MQKDNVIKDLQVQTFTTQGLQIKSDLLSKKGMEPEIRRCLKKKPYSIQGAKEKKRFQGSGQVSTTGVSPL